MDDTRKIDWVFLLGFLLIPLYSLPEVLGRARRCEKTGIITLCLFFAILAFLIVPNYDAANHGHWAWTTFQTGLFWSYNSAHNDLYLVYLEYVILSLGLKYHYVIFVTVLFSAFPFWCMYYQVAKEESLENQKKLFIIFLLLFPFVNTMCGLRYFTAVSWLTYCNYLLLYQNNFKKAVIPLAVVSMTHFAIVVQIIVLLFSFITKIKLGKYNTLIIVLLLCLLSVTFVNQMMPYMYEYFPADKVDQYADAGYMDVLEDQNLNFYISYWIKYSTWLPLSLIALFLYYHKVFEYKLFPSFWCMLLLWAVGSGFTTLEYRWGRIAALFFFLCFFIEGIKRYELPEKFYKLFVSLHIVRYFLEIYGMKSYLQISNHLVYLLFMPYPMLLCMPYDFSVYHYIWQFFIRH